MNKIKMLSIKTFSDRAFLSQMIILLLLVVLYVYNISIHFWTLPAPSDPLQYLGPVAWGTTWAYWPWLDRINLAINLRIFVLLFNEAHFAGMFYVGFVNTLILIISIIFAYRKSGFWAAFLVGIFINTSFLTLGWATYIYPDQTVALYGLLTFVFFFWNNDPEKKFRNVFLAGVFAACISFTKATGIIIPMFFGIYCLIKLDWKNLFRFSFGVFSGALLVLALFILLFNWESFVNCYQHFFGGTINRNISVSTPGRDFGVAYYHELILSIKYFPFIALFMVAGAYVNKTSRMLFLLAWINIIVVCIIRMLAPSIPTYVYIAFIFTVLGLSIYLSDLIKQRDTIQVKQPLVYLITGLIAILLIYFGLQSGIKYSSIEKYDYLYNYLKALDIYTGAKLNYPPYIQRFFTFGPIILLAGLVYILASKSWKSLLIFAFVAAFVSSFLNGGLAYKKAEYDRADADFFYKNAPVLNTVPAKTFTIYVEGWNRHNYSQNILWVYRTFFDKKYQRSFDPKYRSQYLNEYEISGNISYVTREADLPAQTIGTHILTDVPAIVAKYFPHAKPDPQFHDSSNPMLVALDLTDHTITKKIQYTYELDLSALKGKESVIQMDSINKILPQIHVVGVRGIFNLLFNPKEDLNSFRVVLDKPDPKEPSTILFGVIISPEILNKIGSQTKYITMDFEMGSSNAENVAFIEDLVDDVWDYNNIGINQAVNRAYSITRLLRNNPSSVIAGITFNPSGPDDWIQIRKLKITIWTRE